MIRIGLIMFMCCLEARFCVACPVSSPRRALCGQVVDSTMSGGVQHNRSSRDTQYPPTVSLHHRCPFITGLMI